MKNNKNVKKKGKSKPKWGFLLVSLVAVLIFVLVVVFGYYLGSLVNT